VSASPTKTASALEDYLGLLVRALHQAAPTDAVKATVAAIAAARGFSVPA